jgi:hypothetical protein
MFLMSDHGQGGDTDAEGQLVGDNIRSIYGRLPSDRRVWIRIRGANHFGFSDDEALLKSPFLTTLLHGIGIIRLDGRRQLRITSHCISKFFDVHLRGAPASELYVHPSIQRLNISIEHRPGPSRAFRNSDPPALPIADR